MIRSALIFSVLMAGALFAQDPAAPLHRASSVIVIRGPIRPPWSEMGLLSSETFRQLVDLQTRVKEFEASSPPLGDAPRGKMVQGRVNSVASSRYALSDLKATLDAVIKDYRATGEFDVAWKLQGLNGKVVRDEITEEEKLQRVALIRRLFAYGETILNEQIKHREALFPSKKAEETGGDKPTKLQATLIPLAPPSAKAYEDAMPEDLKRTFHLLQVRYQTLSKSLVY